MYGSNSSYGKMNEKLDESNKGHQLLRKMGWGGAGLGAKEQGIEAPINAGEVIIFIKIDRSVGSDVKII